MLEASIVAAKTHRLALAAQFPAAAVARIAASSQGCALELIIGLKSNVRHSWRAGQSDGAPLSQTRAAVLYALYDRNGCPHPQDRRVRFGPDLPANSGR